MIVHVASVSPQLIAMFTLNSAPVESDHSFQHGPLARYVKLRVAYAPGVSGTFSSSPLVSDPRMHHGTCVTARAVVHVAFEGGGGENVPGIPGACGTRKFKYLVRGPVLQ